MGSKFFFIKWRIEILAFFASSFFTSMQLDSLLWFFIFKKDDLRNCFKVSFYLSLSSFRYETGDHLGVFPANDSHLVSELGKLLSVDMDLPFSLINLDGKQSFLKKDYDSIL